METQHYPKKLCKRAILKGFKAELTASERERERERGERERVTHFSSPERRIFFAYSSVYIKALA